MKRKIVLYKTIINYCIMAVGRQPVALTVVVARKINICFLLGRERKKFGKNGVIFFMRIKHQSLSRSISI